MDKHLVALYELKRQSFLNGYIQSPGNFSSALAYAYHHRVAPILHEIDDREVYGDDPFAEVYAVKASFVGEVFKYVDECQIANKFPEIGFYKLEERFGGYKVFRYELKRVLEYLRISGKFDDRVWKAIESNSPAEANSLSDKFSPEDVCFY